MYSNKYKNTKKPEKSETRIGEISILIYHNQREVIIIKFKVLEFQNFPQKSFNMDLKHFRSIDTADRSNT